ncbi:MAG: hypothetical protein M1490_04675 [Candidatus Bathyarchaeota archaeon]|nr:hypothetical protein [Candidatus Bathyarchaeota archaeon]
MRKIGVLVALVLISLCIVPVYGQIVERPSISDVIVHAYWKDNGAKTIDINSSSQAILAVYLLQNSTVESSARITVRSSSPVIIQGIPDTTETLAPGQDETLFFTIQNGGATVDVDNIPITITSYETYGGTEMSKATVYANLLAPPATPTPEALQSSIDYTWIIAALIIAMAIILAAVIIRKKK